MNVSGPAPVILLQRNEDSALALRLNQRLSAEVLQVAGDQVLLSVAGVRIVARLTSPDQAAMLSEHRLANFVVREHDGSQIALQLARPAGSPLLPARAAGVDFIAELLRSAGVPMDKPHATIARALLDQGLPVKPGLVAELRQALDESQEHRAGAHGSGIPVAGWGQEEAAIAAQLKATGRPLTPAAIQLYRQGLASLLDAIQRLRLNLQSFLRTHPPASLESLAQKALAWLDTMVVDWAVPSNELAWQLPRTLAALGRSLEHILGQTLLQAGEPVLLSGEGILSLAHLRRELAQRGIQPLLGEIDSFLDGLRLRHLQAAEPVSVAVKEQWLALDLPLCLSNASAACAHLKIAFQNERQYRWIDPAHTRLVVQVELEAGETVEVDLSMVDRRIGAWVTASSPDIQRIAESELSGFEAGLEKLGFTLHAALCETARPASTPAEETQPAKMVSRLNVKA